MAKTRADLTKKTLHVCIDRKLPTQDPIPRMMHALNVNPENNPSNPGTRDREILETFLHNPDTNFSLADRAVLVRMAILTPTKWRTGQTITIAFLNGSTTQKTKTKKYARYWTDKKNGNANLKLRFLRGKNAMIRISFMADEGSWSYVGTECKEIPADEPTMNFGWLRNDSEEAEWERVVVHEFGHALGCIHEHQNPAGGIQWNKPVVYAFYKKKPNEWEPEDVDSNIFDKYSSTITQFSQMDRDSIMAYYFSPEFTTNGYSMPENSKLSQTDITFIRAQYPK